MNCKNRLQRYFYFMKARNQKDDFLLYLWIINVFMAVAFPNECFSPITPTFFYIRSLSAIVGPYGGRQSVLAFFYAF